MELLKSGLRVEHVAKGDSGKAKVRLKIAIPLNDKVEVPPDLQPVVAQAITAAATQGDDPKAKSSLALNVKWDWSDAKYTFSSPCFGTIETVGSVVLTPQVKVVRGAAQIIMNLEAHLKLSEIAQLAEVVDTDELLTVSTQEAPDQQTDLL